MSKLLSALFAAPAVIATADAATIQINESQVAMLVALWGCAVLGCVWAHNFTK